MDNTLNRQDFCPLLEELYLESLDEVDRGFGLFLLVIEDACNNFQFVNLVEITTLCYCAFLPLTTFLVSLTIITDRFLFWRVSDLRKFSLS